MQTLCLNGHVKKSSAGIANVTRLETQQIQRYLL